jgi:MSHA biogenesis protein MshL
MTHRYIVFSLLMFFVSACQSKPPDAAAQHLISHKTGQLQASSHKIAKGPIPDIVQATPFLVTPAQSIQEERYTVVLHDVPVKELLFTLARDSNINIDIHSDIEGNATINAVEETLPSILERLARQVDFIYETKGGVLIVRPDSKFWHTYNVDYLSMERTSSGSMSLSLESGGEGDATSTADTETTNDSEFWQPIVDGIINIVKLDDAQIAIKEAKRSAAKGTVVAEEDAADEDKNKEDDAAATETTATDDPVVVHQATGTISVLATSNQHKQVQVFFDQILNSAQRQVLIEATIVDVQLNDYFQRGVDWSVVTNSSASGTNMNIGNLATNSTSGLTGSLTSGVSPLLAIGSKLTTGITSFTAELKVLDEFGDVKILSSPKVMAINNQAAMIKVVDEIVFSKTETTNSTDANGNVVQAVNTEAQKALEGIIMSVTPHINDNGIVSLHVRPAISQLIGSDAATGTPYFQVREMDSVLRVPSGQTVILGGLMRDRVATGNNGIPGLSQLPFLGRLFESKTREVKKIETAIFLRPTIMSPENMRDEVEKTELSFEDVKNRFDNGLDWGSIKRKD